MEVISPTGQRVLPKGGSFLVPQSMQGLMVEMGGSGVSCAFEAGAIMKAGERDWDEICSTHNCSKIDSAVRFVKPDVVDKERSKVSVDLTKLHKDVTSIFFLLKFFNGGATFDKAEGEYILVSECADGKTAGEDVAKFTSTASVKQNGCVMSVLYKDPALPGRWRMRILAAYTEARQVTDAKKFTGVIAGSLQSEKALLGWMQANSPIPTLPVTAKFSAKVEVINGQELKGAGTVNPIVKLKLHNQKNKTDVAEGDANPVWNESFGYAEVTGVDVVMVKVGDKQEGGKNGKLAKYEVPVAELLGEQALAGSDDGDVPVAFHCPAGGLVNIRFKFFGLAPEQWAAIAGC